MVGGSSIGVNMDVSEFDSGQKWVTRFQLHENNQKSTGKQLKGTKSLAGQKTRRRGGGRGVC